MALSGLERRWAVDVLESFFPPGSAGLTAGPGEVDTLRDFLRIYEASSVLGRLALRLGVFLAALSPVWVGGRLTTIGGLAPSERADLIQRLLRHRVRSIAELAAILKLAASVALLGSPSVRARSGFDRRPPPRVA